MIKAGCDTCYIQEVVIYVNTSINTGGCDTCKRRYMLYTGGCDTCYIQEVVIHVIYRRL